MIIGQTNLLNTIDKIIDSYPKFSIIIGPKGSGKKQIIKYICDKIGLQVLQYGQKVDEVREAIKTAYEQTKPICYLFADADSMNITAKNCLLKITEEPPKNAYFILTLESLQNTLSTLESRGTILKLDNYSKSEILNYRKFRGYNSLNDNLVSLICDNTGEVDELFKMDIKSFYEYALKLSNYIDKVNTGNIFKISKELKLKDSDMGFNPVLLFKTVRNLYINKAKETGKKEYLLASNVTSNCLTDLKINNLSKQATIDNWIIEVRACLRGM